MPCMVNSHWQIVNDIGLMDSTARIAKVVRSYIGYLFIRENFTKHLVWSNLYNKKKNYILDFAFRVWNTWVRLEELLKSGNERHGITKVSLYKDMSTYPSI